MGCYGPFARSLGAGGPLASAPRLPRSRARSPALLARSVMFDAPPAPARCGSPPGGGAGPDGRYGVIRLAWFGRVAKAGGAAGRSSPLRGTAADQVPSGACRADVDLPADAVLVGDRAEGVAPELLGQRNPDRAAVGEAVEDGPQPRLVGADDRQFHPGLFVEGGVAAVAGPQGDVAAGEQRVDDLAPSTSLAVGSSSPRWVIVVCPPNTSW
jgi:hypothetical protein